MAQYTIGTPIGIGGASSISDKRNVGVAGGQTPNNLISTTLFNASRDIFSMRAQLQILNAGLFTNSYLDAMTANDMVFALRYGYDSAGMF